MRDRAWRGLMPAPRAFFRGEEGGGLRLHAGGGGADPAAARDFAAVAEDGAGAGDGADVVGEVAVNEEEVGDFAGGEGADLVVDADRLRGEAGAGMDRLDRAEAAVVDGGDEAVGVVLVGGDRGDGVAVDDDL